MIISNEIEKRIDDASLGSVFIISDFTDITNYDTARKTLSRLEHENKIKKISRGIYYKPKFSKLLNETVSPNMNSVAEAIARNYGWSITPSGEYVLNLLGLSTQVPGRYLYISSGPYRNYTFDNNEIEFVHRKDKDNYGKSIQTRLIIQAIKSIGKDRINEYIPELRKKISLNDKALILKEGQRSTAWVYATIKEIAKEDVTNVSNCNK